MSNNTSLSNVFDRLQGNKEIKKQKEELKKETSKKKTKPTNTTQQTTDSKTDTDNKTKSKLTTVDTSPKKQEGEGDTFSSSIINKFQEKSRKQTIEETHTRNTLFIRNDLHYRLQELTQHKRGLKTLLINEAVEAILDILEDNHSE